MRNITSLLSFLALAIVLVGCTAKGNSTSEFWVRGNCDMCRENIETALQGVEGVTEASYNLDNNTATVSYDSSKVKEMDLHSY